MNCILDISTKTNVQDSEGDGQTDNEDDGQKDSEGDGQTDTVVKLEPKPKWDFSDEETSDEVYSDNSDIEWDRSGANVPPRGSSAAILAKLHWYLTMGGVDHPDFINSVSQLNQKVNLRRWRRYNFVFIFRGARR